ncbi:MAG TPA: hypothetical protein VM240_12565 [Verrucomicrobiae bacterium]|nr:hypothetical protein [Verrucomicrobiae bacterium]
MKKHFAVVALLAFAPQANADSLAARETQFDDIRIVEGARVEGSTLRFARVEQDTRPAGGMYLCGALAADDALAAAETVASALQLLPASALARLRLRYVVLCSRALAGGQPIGGIPVPPLDLLMLAVGGERADLRHRTLHESWHLAEYRGGSFNDAEWSAQFGGYAHHYPATVRRSPVGSGKPGFVNEYGEAYPHEERAELFAFLLLDPDGTGAQLRRRDDTVLKRKAQAVAERAESLLGVDLSRGL